MWGWHAHAGREASCQGTHADLRPRLFPCSGNVERTESLHDNTLMLTVPLMHEVDTSITG